MKIVYLTPAQRKEIDPCNCGESLKRFAHDVREVLPWHVRVPDPTKVIHEYLALVQKRYSDHEPYLSMQLDNLSKVGRQGGTFPLTKLKELVLPYYTSVPGHLPGHQYMIAARDYLIQLIRDVKSVHGIHYFNFSPSVKSTYAGLPVGGKRNTFDAETVGFAPWRHPMPIIPGERYMRNKPRSIFMLANPDYRYMEREFTVTRQWLTTHLPQFFSAWTNPTLFLEPAIRRRLRKPFYSVEEDYVGMDIRFSRALVQELIYPIYEVLLDERFLRWATYVDESFEAPIYWGNELWIGLHNLLSGIIYTNDFETLYSVILMIAAVLREFGCVYDDMSYLALGDDLTLLGKFSRKSANRMHQYMLEMSEAYGLQLHDDEKARISNNDVRFLRKVYYPQQPIGAGGSYPTVLTLNNIFQPEYLQVKLTTALGADLQRLDGAYFSPDWSMACALYAHSLSPDAVQTLQSASSIQAPVDWWDTLYGQSWDPTASPSFYQVLSCLTKR